MRSVIRDENESWCCASVNIGTATVRVVNAVCYCFLFLCLRPPPLPPAFGVPALRCILPARPAS